MLCLLFIFQRNMVGLLAIVSLIHHPNSQLVGNKLSKLTRGYSPWPAETVRYFQIFLFQLLVFPTNTQQQNSSIFFPRRWNAPPGNHNDMRCREHTYLVALQVEYTDQKPYFHQAFNKLQRERGTERNRMKTFGSKASFISLAILLFAHCLDVEAQSCHPSGKIRGKKPPG